MRRIPTTVFTQILLAGGCCAQHIAYDAHTEALAATATFWQSGAGHWHPSYTANGMLCGCVFSGQESDGWAIAGRIAQSNSILWTFRGGARVVDAMQMINVYFGVAAFGPHRINAFDLAYTTDANPSLASAFVPLAIAGCTAPSAVWSQGNGRVTISCPVPVDFRVSWASQACTGIRLTNLAQNACSNNGNFVLTEVSFRTVTPGVQFVGDSTPGCNGQLVIGVNRPPAVGVADFKLILAGVEPQAAGILGLGALRSSPVELMDLGVWVDPIVQAYSVVRLSALVESVSVSLPIPAGAALQGVVVGAQFGMASSCQPAGFASSRAVQLTVQ